MTTNGNETPQNVIERIRKLLALSQSPNEHEAASAAGKVQALLAEYNLHMSEVVTDEAGHEDDFIIDSELYNKSRPWKRNIAGVTAQLYFCTYFYEEFVDPKSPRGWSNKHCFVGATHNIAVTKMMFQYLVSTMERLAKEAAAKQSKRASYERSFLWGCSGRVAQRIMKRIEETKSAATPASAGVKNLPALADLYEQTEQKLGIFLKKALGADLVSGRDGRAADADAFPDGSAAGARIGLDPQVGGNGPRPAIGGTRHMIGSK